MLPKTTVVILFYFETTSNSDLPNFNFFQLQWIFKFKEWFQNKNTT
jgi:hypothetical protein